MVVFLRYENSLWVSFLFVMYITIIGLDTSNGQTYSPSSCPVRAPKESPKTLPQLQAGFTRDLPSVLQYKYCTDNFVHKTIIVIIYAPLLLHHEDGKFGCS